MRWFLLLYFPISTFGCGAGSFNQNGNCISCPVGWAQPLSNENICETCPTGYVSEESSPQCLGCPRGRFQTGTTCENCPIGKFSYEIATNHCKDCPIGFHQNFEGNSPVTLCSQCPQGWTQPLEGQETCEICETTNCEHCDGYGINGSHCELCPRGQYSNQTKSCQHCPRGFEGSTGNFFQVSDTGAKICVECEQGYAHINDICIECPLGTYSDNYTCVTCPVGYFGDMMPVQICTDCDHCKICPAGYVAGNSVKCDACAAGKYQQEEGQSTCLDCDHTTVSPPASPICEQSCPEGFEGNQSQCTVCPAGKNGTTALTCQLCPEGFVKREDYGECILCPIGRTSTGPRTDCQTCSSGKYSDKGICADCPSGYYMDNLSLFFLNCEAVRPGSYQDEMGADNFKDCLPGTFSLTTGASVCENCTIGKISSSGSANCEFCPTGFGTNKLDTRNNCSVCANNKVTINGQCQFCPKGEELVQDTCAACPQGKVQPTSTGEPCTFCPVDTYSINTTMCVSCSSNNVTNLVGEGSWFCQDIALKRQCSDGTYYNQTCKHCPAGFISSAGATECSACKLGHYEEDNICTACETGTNVINNTCTTCTVGKYGVGSICRNCAQGTYQDAPGQTECKPCGPLQSTVSEGSENVSACIDCSSVMTTVIDGVCATCPPGKINLVNACQNCEGGQYRTTTEDECSPCPIGKRSDSGNPCQNCDIGTYQNEQGQTDCKPCVAGVTTTTCSVCPPGTYGSNCDNCPVGFWSLADEETCSECQLGLYQSEHGQSDCFPCPMGKYTGQTASPACTPCAIGKFQPSERAGICIDCLPGFYTDQIETVTCKKCQPGTYTVSEGSSSGDCIPCPKGTMEVRGICIDCPERFYNDVEGQPECKACPNDELSLKRSTGADACFSKKGLVTYVFGMKGDSKVAQSHKKKCEIRPNLVMLCPGCSCDNDARNGFWDGPVCNECRRGFATRDCTARCPGYDGTHDSTMCHGNGFCWYGKFGNGLCYCGGASDIDKTSEKVVVDVRLCPKGKICPGYGDQEQSETKYLPIYYIMQYRQFSVFVLMLNKYTPQRGHMWFQRFPPSIAHENTCLVCTGAYAKTPKTTIGFWNNKRDYEFFKDELQTFNGFHGENCQYECAVCLNGGRCHHVPHPYRLSYTIEDTFRPQREIFVPQTMCICSSMVFDPENMCCPNGFQPFVHYGLRLNPDPYTRFNRLPYLTSIKNEKRDYWINRDIYLEPDFKYTTPFAEPDDGLMWVANNNLVYSENRQDYIQKSYKEVGPYNKHVFYGVPREICRACPGLFGKGVQTATDFVETEEKAEEFWWDNAMGASARKCNGIGVCDFYKRSEEPTVKFMGDASEIRLYERGKLCNATAIDGIQDRQTKQACIDFGETKDATWIAFAEPYKGGHQTDMVPNYYDSETLAAAAAENMNAPGYASYLNGTENKWTILKNSMPMPDSDSPFVIYSIGTARCAVYTDCNSFIRSPQFNIYERQLGNGADRLEDATFNRFDTCFTFTKNNQIEKFDLYLTQEYEQGQDPFLGGHCPKGHYCTEYNGVGYKEACPAGYYQPREGVSRTVVSSHCNIARLAESGCQENLATSATNDYTDNVCIRCPRNFFAAKGSKQCTECPAGSVKKISGTFSVEQTKILNIPQFHIQGYHPWYYIANEQGYQHTDCAQMPAGIIHIPEANDHMTYERQQFLPVLSCPFGLSSRPGTFSIDQFQNLVALMTSKEESVIQAPYIRFDATFVILPVTRSTCECRGYSSITRTTCKNYLKEQGIDIMLDRAGTKGCFKHAQRPGVGFFSEGSREIPSIAITYLCRDGIDNNALAGQFARANCFRCPGNSMTGPSSTACTTCFANKLKVFAREAIHKYTENTPPQLKHSTDSSSDQMSLSETLPNYALIYEPNVQNYDATHIFEPRRSTDTTTLQMSDCYMACSTINNVTLIAIGILSSDSTKCACSTGQGNSTEYIWKKITGGTNGIYTDWGEEALPLCAACQPGKKNNRGCLPCEQGQYTSTPTQADNEECQQCASGRYVTTTGATTCFTCPTGFYQDELGTPACKGCTIGKYQNISGLVMCHLCPKGRFSNQVGSTNCNKCPTGWKADNVELTKCTACIKGRFADKEASDKCSNCVPGQYSTITGTTECIHCAAGQYQTQEGKGNCEKCETGKHLISTGGSNCNDCSYGKYADQEGSHTCTDCPGGADCYQKGGIEPCLDGHYLEQQQYGFCKECPAGFTPATYKTQCLECATGQSTLSLQGQSECTTCPLAGWSQVGDYYENGRLPLLVKNIRDDFASTQGTSYKSYAESYHTCYPESLELPKCDMGLTPNAGGRRISRTYIIIPESRVYTFDLTVGGWGKITWQRKKGQHWRYDGSSEQMYNEGAVFRIPYEKGDMIQVIIEYWYLTTLAKALSAELKIGPANGIQTFREDPVSPRCANIIL